jgi:16S rRNA (cytosine967-C5)-methyltransferase
MKSLPSNLLSAIRFSLSKIFLEGAYADKEIEKTLKSKKKWGARDRRAFAETVYEVVRWWRALYYLAVPKGEVIPEEPNELNEEEIFQLVELYLSESWATVAPSWLASASGGSDSFGVDPSVIFSVPQWLYQECVQQLGQPSTLTLLRALNEKAPVDLRVNTLKANLKTLKRALDAEGIQTHAFSEIGLSLIERKNVFVSKSFKKGWFEVQDRSSQEVARALDPQPGERVLDACAGAGGKSLQIAMQMKNKGKVIALDVYETKLQELRKRASRAGVDIIEARLVEGKVHKRLAGQFDRVLLDVPCSGLGVLRRNPDSKWKLTPDKLMNLNLLQKEILERYSIACKPGGIMVYSTCSVFPSENEAQIDEFLQRHPEWSLIEQKTFRPDTTGGDGF